MISEYQKKKNKWASCNISQAYIGAIEHHCPKAKLFLDRFHIAKALNKASDEVRKEQWRQASPDMNVKPLRGFVPPIGGIQAFFQSFQKGLSYPQWPEKRQLSYSSSMGVKGRV